MSELMKLGDVTDVFAGVGFPKEMQGRQDGAIPVFKVGDISAAWLQGKNFLTESRNYLSQEDAKSLGRLVPAGATVFAKIGEALRLNRRVMLGCAALVDNNVMGLVPDEAKVSPKYLYYFMQTVDLGDLSRSTTVPSIRKSDVLDIPINVPGLAEQDEIVAEIEKQFSRLDEAVANLQRVKANLKRYKASVLKAAVEGRLTEGNVDAFRRLRLGELVELNPRLPKGSLDDSSSVSFVPMAAVGADDGCLDVTTIRSYSEVRKGYTYFADGDVLFAKVTPCMENGKIAVVKGLVGGIGFGSTEFHVMRPRPNVDPRYVYCIVSSESFRKEAARHMTGAVGLRRVPTAFLESVEVSVPPLDKQLLVVSEVDRQLTIIQEIEAEVDVNLQRSKVLRQATLEKTLFNRRFKSNVMDM